MTKWVALVTAFVLVAAACMSARKSGEGGDLVWAIGAIDARPGSAASSIVAMWNQLHPNGPNVRIEALPESTDDARQQMVLELNAQSSELDILTLDSVRTGEFAERGWLVDLKDIRSSIEKVSLPGPLQSATWGGTLWAAPYTTDAPILYYRTDLIDQPPRTWDELMKVGLEAGQARIAPFVAQGAQYEGMVVNFLEYFWGAGGDLFNADGTEVRFQKDAALQAIEFMRTALQNRFYAPGFNTMKEEDARNAFQSGNAVFMRNWPYAFYLMSGQDPRNPSQVAGKFGIAPLPTFDGKGTISGLGGHNLAVNRFSDNVEAAKEFVRFASTTPEVQRHLGKHSMIPTMKSVFDDLAGDPVMALQSQILPHAKPRPTTPKWSEISEVIQRQIFSAYNGQRDPEQAVETIREFLQSTLDQG
jgi:multiple sugar transport system substrate-binding protein